MSSKVTLPPFPPRSMRAIGLVITSLHPPNSNTSSMVDIRRGKTTSKNVRSCDTVRAGAFFSQAQLQVPQKEMRQHRRQHVVMPARIFADCIVVHPQLGFAFFAALFHGPPQPTSPDQSTQ